MDGKRNIQIEGLRGIAILFVIIYHVFDRYQQIYLKQEIKFLNHWGSFGVTVFFMISAYFAVSPVTNECDLKFGVKKWLRKVLRLWPSYFVSIVIIFITTRIVYLPERTVSFSEFLMNMFLINRFWGIPYVDGAHWYLNALISMFLVNGIIQIGKTHKWPWRYLLWMALVIVEEKIFDTGDMYLLGGPYVTVFCMGIALRFLIEIENRETRKNWFIVLILGLITTYGIRGGGSRY